MNINRILTILGLLSLLGSGTAAVAQGTAFTYQGRLDSSGAPANGSFDLRFAVYDAASGGSPLAGPLTNSAVGVSNGLFTVTLDFGAGIFTGPARWLEIAVRTNGGGVFTALTPRQSLTPAPYALYAPNAGTAASATTVAPNGVATTSLQTNAVTTDKIADGTIGTADIATIEGGKIVGGDLTAARLKVGTNQTLSGAWATIAGGILNSAGDYGATVGGGQLNSASGYLATIGGGKFNAVEAYYSAIAGGSDNAIRTGATSAIIGGGYRNMIEAGAYSSTIGGGQDNSISTNATAVVITGGYGNRIENAVHGAVISGGTQNRIRSESFGSASLATIAGGNFNTIEADAYAATIGGGVGNRADLHAQYATVTGGLSNFIGSFSLRATIAGGGRNWILNNCNDATVAGGFGNLISTATPGAAIGGGSGNTVSGSASYSTIAGGLTNMVGPGAYCATIPGGRNNTADGDYALAAGRRAKANHAGSFVWADSTDADFASTRSNQFNLRATGGVRVDTGAGPGISLSAADTPLITRGWDAFAPTAPAAKQGHGRWGLFMESFRLAIGIPDDVGGRYFEVAKYSTNGTSTPLMTVNQAGTVTATAFNPTSDRAAKENFAPVDCGAVLDKVAALPLARWNFKHEPGVTHLGPVAQDFHAAFGLGTDDKHIATVDADGVALAAIQGLNQKLEETRSELKRREAENAELKRELAEIKRLVQQLLK